MQKEISEKEKLIQKIVRLKFRGLRANAGTSAACGTQCGDDSCECQDALCKECLHTPKTECHSSCKFISVCNGDSHPIPV